MNRLTNLASAKAGTTLASYAYTLGPAANRLSVIEATGRQVAYTYDALYRLTGETITSDPGGLNGAVTYTLDPVGNRLSRTSTLAAVPSTSNSYDANDRIIGTTYDLNGNTTAANANTYAYDSANRLKQAAPLGETFVYDGDGNRIASTTGGTTTTYLVDTQNPTGHAQVLEELAGTAVQRVYTYGLARISESQILTDTWSTNFYGYDGQGSVRFLTNAAGAMTDQYAYDAFGNQIAVSGTTPNAYRFTAEPFDQNLQLLYLRARYLSPLNGRFLTADCVAGSLLDPPSLHRYLYVGGDPVNRVDPSGQFWEMVAGALAFLSQAKEALNDPITALQRAWYGSKIHREIGKDFRNQAQDPYVDRPLYEILGIKPTDMWNPRLRPDLVDAETAEVYEIKPEGSEDLGAWQLQGYLLHLLYWDPEHRQWHAGSSYEVQATVIPLEHWGLFAEVDQPNEGGVIIYHIIDLRLTLATLALCGVVGLSLFEAGAGPVALRELLHVEPGLIPLPQLAFAP